MAQPWSGSLTIFRSMAEPFVRQNGHERTFLLSIRTQPFVNHAEQGTQHEHSDDQRHHRISPPPSIN